MRYASLFFRAVLVVASLGGVCALLPGGACAPKKGALMLAVTTDMRAPKDINVISVAIQVGPEIKFNFMGRVTPEGEVLLPATLAIVEPDDPGATIQIRVIAFKDTKPRVLRDVLTTVPRDGRIALLRMPLSFVNDDSATGALPIENLPAKDLQDGGLSTKGGAGAHSIVTADLHPTANAFNPFGGEVISRCDVESPPTISAEGVVTDRKTMVDGTCVNAHVDEASLPDFEDTLVRRRDSKCFNCKDCFGGQWREVTANLADCTVAKDGVVTNVGLVTKDTGDCSEGGECFVPIDKGDPTAGDKGGESVWLDDGAIIRLSNGACNKIKNGAKLAVVASTTCEPKTATFPVCVGASIAAPDAGPVVAEAGVDAGPPNVEPVFAADNVSGLAVFADRIYFGSTKGIFEVPKGGTPGATPMANSLPSTGPWFATTLEDKVAFANGEPITAGSQRRGYYTKNDGPNVSLTTISLTNAPSNTSVGGIAFTAVAPTVFLPVYDKQGTVGAVYWMDFVGGSSPQSNVLGSNPTSIAWVGNLDKLLVGDRAGNVGLYFRADFTPTGTPGSIDSIECDQAKTLPVLGLATADTALDVRGFALREDGIFYLFKPDASTPMAANRVSSDALTSIQPNGIDHPRGVAARIRSNTTVCAFYTSSTGVSYVTADGGTTGVLATIAEMKGQQPLGVTSPVLSGGGDPYVYFAAYGLASAGGGIYRVKVPASCL